jgi:hypothetical protein
LSTDGSRDASTTSKFIGTEIKLFRFFCPGLLWHNILSQVNVVNKSDANVSLLIEVLENIIEYLKSIRSEEIFNQLIVDAKKLVEDVNVQNFPIVNCQST